MTDMDALFDGGNAHLLPGGPAHTVALLKHFNAWRRGDERLEMPNPAEIGLAIDSAIELIETLEADAKRYRFLRNQPLSDKFPAGWYVAQVIQDGVVELATARNLDTLDSAIDAAMEGHEMMTARPEPGVMEPTLWQP